MGLFMSQMLPDVLEYCIEAPVKIALEIKNFYILPSWEKARYYTDSDSLTTELIWTPPFSQGPGWVWLRPSWSSSPSPGGWAGGWVAPLPLSLKMSEQRRFSRCFLSWSEQHLTVQNENCEKWTVSDDYKKCTNKMIISDIWYISYLYLIWLALNY